MPLRPAWACGHLRRLRGPLKQFPTVSHRYPSPRQGEEIQSLNAKFGSKGFRILRGVEMNLPREMYKPRSDEAELSQGACFGDKHTCFDRPSKGGASRASEGAPLLVAPMDLTRARVGRRCVESLVAAAHLSNRTSLRPQTRSGSGGAPRVARSRVAAASRGARRTGCRGMPRVRAAPPEPIAAYSPGRELYAPRADSRWYARVASQVTSGRSVEESARSEVRHHRVPKVRTRRSDIPRSAAPPKRR
jgi:hypothetical protein